MGGVLWLSSVETSEPVGIPMHRIALIEQKSGQEGHVVAVFLDTGKELRVIESLAAIKSQIENQMHGTHVDGRVV